MALIVPSGRAVSYTHLDDYLTKPFSVEEMLARVRANLRRSTMAMHLSRLAEEIVLWSSSEFGYITLSDAYSCLLYTSRCV